MIRLSITLDGGRPEVKEFTAEDILIGRSEDADLRLDNDSVSRRHARLIRKSEGWKVADLGAANGVFLMRGGLPPQHRVIVEDIQSGDVVCVEKFRVMFEVVDGASLATPRPDGPALPFGDGTTRVTTLPRMAAPDLSALKSRPSPEAETSGTTLDALLAISGAPVTRLTRADSRGTRGPVLEVLEPNAAAPRSLPLSGGPIQFGSDPQCDVRIEGLTVPRFLAAVELVDRKVFLRRMSTGLLGPRITVEGQQVKEAELKAGQSALVGPVKITFTTG